MKNTTSENVYTYLKNDILNLIILPGEEITEKWICDRYKVSRTPSRDAITRLENEGLVDSIPYKSNHVSLLDFDRVLQLIYMRVALETQVMIDSFELITDENIAEFEYNLTLQSIFVDNPKECSKFYDLDAKFHKIFFNAANKNVVWREIQKSLIHYSRFRMLDLSITKNFNEIYLEHKKIYEIIRNKDANAVEELMTKHLYGGVRRIEEYMKSDLKCVSYFKEISIHANGGE